MNGAAQMEQVARSAFEETHFAVSYWADRWGFSAKTVRDWFRDEYGPGILRQPNTGRRSKRDFSERRGADLCKANRFGRDSAADPRGNVNT